VSVGAGEDHAAGLDYEVNLKTELEIMSLHDKIDGVLAAHLAEVSQTQRELTTLSITVASSVSGGPCRLRLGGIGARRTMR
jgi:uncharacterized membrane protein